MNKTELIELVRELHEKYIPVSFKSLLNTLQLCDDIIEYSMPSNTYSFSFYNGQPCYCINIYMYIDNKKRQEANLWIGFIDKNNCHIMQYYNMHSEQPEYNINRAGINDTNENYNDLIIINTKSINWIRKKNRKKILKHKAITDI